MPLKFPWPSRRKHYDPLYCWEIFTQEYTKHPIWLESRHVMFVVCFIHKTQIIWVCQLQISHFWNIKEAAVVYIQHIVKLALKFSFTEFFLKFTWQLQKHYNYFSEKRNFFTLHKGGKMYSNFKHAFSKCFLIQLCTHHSPHCKYQPISYYWIQNIFFHAFNKLFTAQKTFQISVYIKRSAFSVTTNI